MLTGGGKLRETRKSNVKITNGKKNPYVVDEYEKSTEKDRNEKNKI